MLGLADIHIFDEAFKRLTCACANDPKRLVDACRVDSVLATLCQEVARKAALQQAALSENPGLAGSLPRELSESLRDYDARWSGAVEDGSHLGAERIPAATGDTAGTWFDLPAPNQGFLPEEMLPVLGSISPGAMPHPEAPDQSAQQLTSSLECANIGLFHVVLNRSRVWVSDTLLAIQGYTKEEALRHPDWPWFFMPVNNREHVHPDDRASLEAAIRASFAPGGSDICDPEFRLKHKLGHWVWVQNIARVSERDDLGRATKYLGARKDVTERRVREDHLRSLISELHQTQHKLDLAIDGGALGTWSWKQAERRGLLSYAAAEMVGLGHSITLNSVYRVIHPDDRNDLKIFLRTLAGGQRSEAEFRVRHRNGQTRWLHCIGRQTIGPDGVVSVDGVMMDATESRAAELTLRKSQEELSDARMRVLRYQVNPHFLFNSLSSVSTLIVENEHLRADDMVMKLAAFYRESLKQDPLSLVTLADEVRMQQLYLSIEEIRFPELRTEFDIPADLADMLVPSLILQPLVENAIKYGMTVKDEFRVQIKARRKRGMATVSVTDNGKGLNKSGGGTGWGLRITERRLELSFPNRYRFNAGRLPDRGFSVTFDIPIMLQAPLQEAGRGNGC